MATPEPTVILRGLRGHEYRRGVGSVTISKADFEAARGHDQSFANRPLTGSLPPQSSN